MHLQVERKRAIENEGKSVYECEKLWYNIAIIIFFDRAPRNYDVEWPPKLLIFVQCNYCIIYHTYCHIIQVYQKNMEICRNGNTAHNE